VYTTIPKFKPLRVSECPPVMGPFLCVCDRTGASKLKSIKPVPITPAMVTVATGNVDLTCADVHATKVAEVHDAEIHNASERPTETVKSDAPRLRPLTVNTAPPVLGTFRLACELNGASNVKATALVPTTVGKTKVELEDGSAEVALRHMMYVCEAQEEL
jgi:hypothetical protein